LSSELFTYFIDRRSTLSGRDNLAEILCKYRKIGIGFFDTFGELLSVADFLCYLVDAFLKNSIITSLRSEIKRF